MLLLFLWYGSCTCTHENILQNLPKSLNTACSHISKHYKKKKFIILSTIFILHTLFHYKVEVPCAYVKCYFALSLFQPVLQCIFSHKLLKKENVTTIPFCGWGNWGIQRFNILPNSTCVVTEKQVRSPVFCTLCPVYSLL